MVYLISIFCDKGCTNRRGHTTFEAIVLSQSTAECKDNIFSDDERGTSILLVLQTNYWYTIGRVFHVINPRRHYCLAIFGSRWPCPSWGAAGWSPGKGIQARIVSEHIYRCSVRRLSIPRADMVLWKVSNLQGQCIHG